MIIKKLEITTQLIDEEGEKWEALVKSIYKKRPTAQDGYMAGFLRAMELQGAMEIKPDDDKSKP